MNISNAHWTLLVVYMQKKEVRCGLLVACGRRSLTLHVPCVHTPSRRSGALLRLDERLGQALGGRHHALDPRRGQGACSRANRGATAICIRPSHGVSPRPLLLPVPYSLLALLLQDKKGIADYSTDDWQTFDREVHVPQQGNGVDCGVFTCICADFTSEDLPLRYSPDDMLFFREKICADILRGNLTYPV